MLSFSQIKLHHHPQRRLLPVVDVLLHDFMIVYSELPIYSGQVSFVSLCRPNTISNSDRKPFASSFRSLMKNLLESLGVIYSRKTPRHAPKSNYNSHSTFSLLLICFPQSLPGLIEYSFFISAPHVIEIGKIQKFNDSDLR